ncbi:MAG: ABC transporter ATP-binding protein [bacterium]|nr:ABC transporter ATP-binding protein [bacterium]
MRKADKNNKLPMLRLIARFAGYAWKCKPLWFLLYGLKNLMLIIMVFSEMIFPALIIDELLGSRRVELVILYTALTVGISMICGFSYNMMHFTTEKHRDLFERYLDVMISEKCIRMDFQHTEDKKVLEQLEKAKTGISWYSGGISGILGTVGDILRDFILLFGVIAILITGMPWLLVVYLISIALDAFFTSRINKVDMQAFQNLAKVNQVFNYVFWELQDIRFGKDIRLYGAEPLMEQKADYYNTQMTREKRAQAMKNLPYNEGSAVLNVLRNAVVILIIGMAALRKVISIGDLTMYYNAGNKFRDSMQGVVRGIQTLRQKLNYAKEFVTFMEYPDAVHHGTHPVPEAAAHTIEFRNVSFAYPGSNVSVLKNINVTLHPGEHISIVGQNGAGKTTFIKLLCRLYDPTEGQILLDGVNIQQIDYEEYVRLLSVVFQDFQLFAFTARENVTLTESHAKAEDVRQNEHKMVEKFGSRAAVPDEMVQAQDDAAFERVIAQAGLTDTVSRLKYGADTFIKQSFDEEGVDLSGGQQQKIAIARALYKDAPIVILDEPTAALDPIAEYEIYRQFSTLVDGKTAIYISHRLSSCQFCDVIYVFVDGRIQETGTHDELVKRENGFYAKLFEAQAQYYRS